MDRLKTENKFIIFKPADGTLPKTLEELPRYLRRLVIWVEGLYKDIAIRVNWLMGLDPILVTEDYTANGRWLILIDASANAVTVTLPDAANYKHGFNVKCWDKTNAAKVETYGSQTIDEAADYTFTAQYDCITLKPFNSNWIIVAEK